MECLSEYEKRWMEAILGVDFPYRSLILRQIRASTIEKVIYPDAVSIRFFGASGLEAVPDHERQPIFMRAFQGYRWPIAAQLLMSKGIASEVFIYNEAGFDLDFERSSLADLDHEIRYLYPDMEASVQMLIADGTLRVVETGEGPAIEVLEPADPQRAQGVLCAIRGAIDPAMDCSVQEPTPMAQSVLVDLWRGDGVLYQAHVVFSGLAKYASVWVEKEGGTPMLPNATCTPHTDYYPNGACVQAIRQALRAQGFAVIPQYDMYGEMPLCESSDDRHRITLNDCIFGLS